LCHTNSDCELGSACPHRRCVNPDHLEVVTPRENAIRNRSFATIFRMTTHCPSGHEYTEANIYRRPGCNSRYCRTCARINGRKQKARVRALKSDQTDAVKGVTASALSGV